MQTVSFKIPIKDIPVFKGAARQLSIDLITETFNQGDEWVNAHAIVHDLTSLVSLGYIAGSDAIYIATKNPMTQLIEGLERKIDDFENKKP